MYKELHILKTYVDQVLADQITYQSNAMINQVTAECARLQVFLFNTSNKADDGKKLAEILNWYQNSIIKRADALFEMADRGHHVATQVI